MTLTTEAKIEIPADIGKSASSGRLDSPKPYWQVILLNKLPTHEVLNNE